MDLAESGDRVVVSQCPRVLTDGSFEEAAVVKFVVAGAGSMRQLGRLGSCMDISRLAETTAVPHASPKGSSNGAVAAPA